MSEANSQAQPLAIGEIAAQLAKGIEPGLNRLSGSIVAGGKSAARDVEHRMYEQATEASAHYALQHMVTARPIRALKYASAGRLDLLEYALGHVRLEGIYAEFGVHQGETFSFIANRSASVVYGFDSFEGLPEDWFLGVTKGYFDLKGVLPEISITQNNYRLVKGWFQDTLPEFMSQIEGPAAFLHIDCDLYSSTKTIFEHFEPRIVPGTVIVFDEYFNYPGWQNHEFKAFHEFVARTGIKYRYIAFAPQMFSVAVIVE